VIIADLLIRSMLVLLCVILMFGPRRDTVAEVAAKELRLAFHPQLSMDSIALLI
jgi:hypothetical protein